MKLKKLTTQQVHFLMELDGAVTRELAMNWQENPADSSFSSIKRDQKDHQDHLYICLCFVAIFITLMVALTAIISILELFSTTWIIVPLMVLIVITIKWAHEAQSPLTDQLNRLQEVFHTYGREETKHLSYLLNKPWIWMADEAEAILLGLSSSLRTQVGVFGPASPEAIEAHKKFHSCHDSFFDFKLCDGNTDKWLTVQDDKPQEELVH